MINMLGYAFYMTGIYEFIYLFTLIYYLLYINILKLKSNLQSSLSFIRFVATTRVISVLSDTWQLMLFVVRAKNKKKEPWKGHGPV